MQSRRFLGSVAVAAILLAVGPAQAGFSCVNNPNATYVCQQPTASTINGAGSKRKTDEFFVGINWNFGSKGPELVLGARSMRMNAWGNGDGARLDFLFPLAGGFSFDRVRLSYVNGHRSALGELGLGYSFLQKTPFVTGAIQAPYVQFGVDYLFTGKFMPFIGVNSLKKPKVAGGVASCGTGTLTPVSTLQTNFSGLFVDPTLIIDGQTCFTDNSNNG
jgi:hypothetical protein